MTKLLFCSLRKKLIVLFSFLNMFSRCSQKSGIYIHEIFKPSLCKYGTRSQMALDIPLRKINTGQKSSSFLGPKIWSKIGPSIKMLEHRLLSWMLLRKILYFICKTNSSYYHILMIDIIIRFSHSKIISSCHHLYPFKSFVIF